MSSTWCSVRQETTGELEAARGLPTGRRIPMCRSAVAAMVRTFGLTHVALAVRDVDRSSRFYQQVFGAVEVYRPYLFALDPDGYEFEIWFDLPTPVDPAAPPPAGSGSHP